MPVSRTVSTLGTVQASMASRPQEPEYKKFIVCEQMFSSRFVITLPVFLRLLHCTVFRRGMESDFNIFTSICACIENTYRATHVSYVMHLNLCLMDTFSLK